ncbi:MAG: extracellular solute-binding protein [Anaerolineae bacterium]|nr:extracellular solute-binding protein [Anaerolineae bacterium]
MKILRISLLGIMLAIVCSGCAWLPTSEPPQTPIPTDFPTSTPEPTLTPTATPLPSVATLTLWVPGFLSPYEDATGAAIFHEQLAAFSLIQPDIQVQIIVKKETGTGGLYNMLSTAYVAAPTVLPDVIILSEYDLQTATDAGYLQPLDATLVQTTDFFPFVRIADPAITTTYGVPFVIEAEQTAYRQNVAATAPLSWTAVLTGNYSLLFPAAPADELASDSVLAAYIGAGGATSDENGKAKLDRAALEQVYRFVAEMVANNLIDVERISGLEDATACWELYQEGTGRMSVVPAGLFWIAPVEGTSPGWIPTPTGNPITIGHVWSMAMVSQDPYHQKAALKLLEWLTTPEQVADLTRATHMLPARFHAIELWDLLPEETAFLKQLLDGAVPSLPPSIDAPVRRALQAGLTAILNADVETPEKAASYALNSLHP